MNFDTFLKTTVNIKHKDLLGETAHAKLSPPFRLKLAEKYKEKQKHAAKAGVMALFYPNKNNDTCVALILRNTYKGVHSAQVGFPGGKLEQQDNNDLLQTALRETEEEIGIPKTDIKVIKTLTPLYIPPSNFMVYPYMGYLEKTPRFQKEEAEVQDVIEVTLSAFLNPKNLITTKVATSYNVEVNVPAFMLNGHVVWGATAMMLSEIKELLKQAL